MGHRIARWLFEPLLRLLFPGTGRRRRTAAAVPQDRPPVTIHLHSPIARAEWERPLRGEGSPLVRSYVALHSMEATA